MTTTQRSFDELAALDGRIDAAELDAVWAQLEPARLEDLVGARWRGFGFDTGHRMYAQLRESHWYGKDFTDPMDVQPLLCQAADGSLSSDLKTGRGPASLWMVEFRGESTATMVYDGMPVFDHFKKAGPDSLMGIMNGKSIVLDGGEHFYFGLRRD